MMHKWESTEKLLPEWESQPHGENYDYQLFNYKKDEFDNVPPVVPKFLFYLQLNLKPLCDFTKKFVTLQTVEELRTEISGWRGEDHSDLDRREQQLKTADDTLNKRCDILQQQINKINEQRAAEQADKASKASQNLYGDDHFKLDESKFKSQFEKPTANYLSIMESQAWQEPRMFTLQQLRNTFYALTHQSSSQHNLEQTMQETADLIKETIRLDVVDKQLDFNVKDNYKLQSKLTNQNFDEFKQHVQIADQRNQDALKKIDKLQDTATAHKTTLDELRRTLQSAIDNGARTAARLEKTKENLQDDIARNRDEIFVKIDFNDRFCIEQFDIIKSHSSKDRNTFQAAMNELKEQLQGELTTEAEQIKSYVLQITNRASAHRETLQEKYDEKLDKIKDVCAQYFSKYEKHLMNQQEIIKGLEKRQEDWINTLLKPQELNQARLFSIDTRVKESDLLRAEDNKFYKDTLKKLIFALEQNQGTGGQQANNQQMSASQQRGFSPTSAQNQTFPADFTGAKRPAKSSRHASTAVGQSRPMNMQSGQHKQQMSIADMQFGQQMPQNQLVLYPQHQNGALLPVISQDESKKQPLSFMDIRINTADQFSSNLPSSNNILFLKRLLFLKATLDNQA